MAFGARPAGAHRRLIERLRFACDSPLVSGEAVKGVLSQVLSQKEGTKNPGWCGVLRGKASTIPGRRSIRTAPTPYLRNTLPPDGSPAVKEDVERYLLGHAGKDVHAGYGEQWIIKTLKAAIEIIPNPLQAPSCGAEGGAVQLVNP